MEETGQVFLTEAVAEVYELTQGQPWLVNAIAAQLTDALVADRKLPITAAHVSQAKQILIQCQDTHLDSLAERLQESRVRRVIEPMSAGQELGAITPDDRQSVIDLGWVKRHPAGGLVIANPIYREVLPQVLASSPQDRQLDRYLEGLGLDSGWLVIFDRRPGLPEIAERTTVEEMRSPAN